MRRIPCLLLIIVALTAALASVSTTRASEPVLTTSLSNAAAERARPGPVRDGVSRTDAGRRFGDLGSAARADVDQAIRHGLSGSILAEREAEWVAETSTLPAAGVGALDTARPRLSALCLAIATLLAALGVWARDAAPRLAVVPAKRHSHATVMARADPELFPFHPRAVPQARRPWRWSGPATGHPQERNRQMSNAIRVIIVAREPLYRRGFVDCLMADDRFEVTGSVATAAEGYRLAEDTAPDVALVGTTLATAPGLAFATELRRRCPAVAVVVLAAAEDDDELFAAIRVGVAAYSGRDISEAQLGDLVGRTAHGEYVINEQLLSKPPVAERVLDQFRRHAHTNPALSRAFMPLSGRELEILSKVSNGMTNAEIGDALGISGFTVKGHVTSILRKLAVNDRTQAVVTALKRGWLTIELDPVPNGTDHGRSSIPTSPRRTADPRVPDS